MYEKSQFRPVRVEHMETSVQMYHNVLFLCFLPRQWRVVEGLDEELVDAETRASDQITNTFVTLPGWGDERETDWKKFSNLAGSQYDVHGNIDMTIALTRFLYDSS